MARLLGWLLVPSLFTLLGLAAPLNAQTRANPVDDQAGFFSKAAIEQAQTEIAKIQRQFKKEVVIETVVEVKLPKDIDANDKTAVNRYMDEWARKRFDNDKVNGVFVVIVEKPAKVRVRLGNVTAKSGLFRNEDLKELDNKVIAGLKASRENPSKKDEVLLGAVRFVFERMNQNYQNKQAALTESKNPAPVAAAPGARAQGHETPWLTYLIIGVVAILVLWLIMGVVRGLSGGGGAAPGMAGGGGGGGGFFSSLLGGMFGAAAGMWLYSNFFGGHSSSAYGGDHSTGYGSSGSDPTDVGGGSTGAGGDWDSGGSSGGDAGGGDAGGGGGDAGGGGGDWGGGGGGDWGGGGGDFGGGGGGGDW